MPRTSTLPRPSASPRRRTLTPRELEDARDVAYIKSARRHGLRFYSWNEFMKELGFDDLVAPRRKSS